VWQHREKKVTVVLRLECIPYAPKEILEQDPLVGKVETWNVWVTTPLGMKVTPYHDRVEGIKEAIAVMKEMDEIFEG